MKIQRDWPVRITRGELADDGALKRRKVTTQPSIQSGRGLKREDPTLVSNQGCGNGGEVTDIGAEVDKNHPWFEKRLQGLHKSAFVSACPHQTLDPLFRIEVNSQAGERMAVNFSLLPCKKKIGDSPLPAHRRGLENPLNNWQETIHRAARWAQPRGVRAFSAGL